MNIADKIMRNAASIQSRLCLTSLGELDARRKLVEEAKDEKEGKEAQQES